MRILKIELQNINSLKAETPILIDFESDQFQDIGLYAITGPTGAGKTTILDAITIALYHQVPRFNKSNIKAGLANIVSHGASDALSRVTFITKNIRYEAQWSMRLISKNGKKLTKPDENVRLKNLDSGKILVEKKSEFKSHIEKITQLTYPQFLRSVMLAQGEFAAFLSANARDKGTLLEQITGEEIYKKIGETISLRKAQETKKLETIKSKINTEDLLSDEERATNLQTQKKLAADIARLTPQSLKLEKIIQWYAKDETLQQEHHDLQATEQRLITNQKTLEPTLTLLALHEKAKPYKEQIDQIKRLEKNLLDKREQFEHLNQQIIKVTQTLETAKKTHQDQQKTALQAEKDRNVWLPKLEQVTKLDTDIQNQQQQKNNLLFSLKQLNTTRDTLQKEITTKKEQHIALSKEVTTITQFLDTHKNDLQVEKEITNWTTQLTIRKGNWDNINHETILIKNKEQDLSTTQLAIAENNTALVKNNKVLQSRLHTVATIEAELQKNELQTLLFTLDKIKIQKEAYTALQTLAKSYDTDLKTKTTLDLQLQEQQSRKKTIEEQQRNINTQLTKAEEAVRDTEKIIELERAIKSFEEERKKLIEGEPCNLCGALSHPYVEKYQAITLSKSEQKLVKRKTALNTLLDTSKKLEIKSAQTTTSIDNILDQITILAAKLLQYAQEFNTLNPSINIKNTAQIEEALITILEQEKNTTQLINTVQKLQQQKDLNTKILNTEQEQVHRLKNTIDTLSEKNKNLQSEIKEKKRALDKLNDDNQILETKLVEEFDTYQLQLPILSNTTAFIKKLEATILTYREKTKQRTEHQNLIAQLQISLDAFQQQWNEKTTEHTNLQKDIAHTDQILLQANETRKSILPIAVTTAQKREQLNKTVEETKQNAENANKIYQQLLTEQTSYQKQQDAIKKEGEALKNEYTTINTTLKQTIAETTDFSTRESIEKVLLNNEDETKYIALRRKLEDQKLALKTQTKQWQVAIKKQESEKNFDQTLDLVKREQETVQKTKDELLKNTGEIKKQLQLDDQIRARNKTIVTEISKQEKIVQKWTQLLQIIGGSKDAFNTYVQRLTLQNLIHLANIHLFNLNKRYSLEMKAIYTKGEELNFMLVDHYQANESRLVDTSSGGEKFLISLSLALGLSDLASHNVSIGSLFIDEGFGTLDNHTLETVIATLETLQAQGKMIGIISHVENLKERIPTQIQVHKKNNGVSAVTIV